MELAFMGIADSLIGGGSTTAPGAHGVIGTQIANVPVGKYRCKVRYALSGTAETALSNLEINANGGTPFTGLPTITGSGWNEIEFDLTVTSISAFRAASTAAATAGAVYSCVYTLTRLKASA